MTFIKCSFSCDSIYSNEPLAKRDSRVLAHSVLFPAVSDANNSSPGSGLAFDFKISSI